MIDLTYPTSVLEWKNLISTVEVGSNYKILIGFSGIKELFEPVKHLFVSDSSNKKKAEENAECYLREAAKICFDNPLVGIECYKYFAEKLDELKIPYENKVDLKDLMNLQNLNKEYSIKEINDAIKHKDNRDETFFDDMHDWGRNIDENSKEKMKNNFNNAIKQVTGQTIDDDFFL